MLYERVIAESRGTCTDGVKSKVKSPTRKTDVWGTPIYLTALCPGHPPVSCRMKTEREG